MSKIYKWRTQTHPLYHFAQDPLELLKLHKGHLQKVAIASEWSRFSHTSMER